MKKKRKFQIIIAILALIGITFTACNKEQVEIPEIFIEEVSPTVNYSKTNTIDVPDGVIVTQAIGGSCDISLYIKVVSECNDNGTPQKQTDDFYTVNLTFNYEGEPTTYGCTLV